MNRNALIGTAVALQERNRQKAALRAGLFDRQLAVHDDPAQFRAMHPGRRGGKSEYLPRGCLLDVLDAGFNEAVLLGAETQKKARALHWGNIGKLVREYQLPLVPNLQDAAWLTPWGARIQLWGISDQNAVDLARGFKMRAARFDEVATYSPLLKYLVQDVMKPSLADTGGTLTLAGTPSVTRAGAWFEICCKGFGNFSVHHWDMRQNVKFPRDPHKVLAAALADLGGDESNATYQREWLGLFVDDPGMQVYKYLAPRNDVDALPKHYDRASWIHIVALDFGVVDDCAWSVLAMHRDERRAYVLKSGKRAGLLPDESAVITAELCGIYQPIKLIGDVGGLGKPYAVEWNRRYAGQTAAELRRRIASLSEPLARVPSGYAMPGMESADKREKRAGIEFVNNELVAGRLLFVQPECEPLTSELVSLPWKDEKRLEEHPAYANHCSDTCLYGARELRPFLNEAPERRLDVYANRVEYDRWQEQRESEQHSQADWDLY